MDPEKALLKKNAFKGGIIVFPPLLYWLYYANNELLVQTEETGTFLCFKEVFGSIRRRTLSLL